MTPRSIILSLLTLLLTSCTIYNFGDPEPLVIHPGHLKAAVVGQEYKARFWVTNYKSTPLAEIYVNEGELPPGLTFTYFPEQETAEISGLANRAGRYVFTIAAYCHSTQRAGQSGERKYTLVVTE